MQVSNNIYLFVVSCEIKYATYIVAGGYKSPWPGGAASSVGVISLQRQHLLWRVRTKNKVQKPTTPTYSEQ
jgi:hypothetical protein